MFRKTIIALAAIMLSTSFAGAVTIQAITEGTRPTVTGTVNIGGDAAGTPEGFSLSSLTAAGQSIDIHGRIVGSIDYFNFTSTTSVLIEWIFGGYSTAGGFVPNSGFVLEGSSGGNTVDISVYTPDSSGVKIGALANPYSTNITSTAGNGGTDAIFALLAPGSYTLEIDNSSPSKAALYDIRVSAVPLPAGVVLLLSGLGVMGIARMRRKA